MRPRFLSNIERFGDISKDALKIKKTEEEKLKNAIEPSDAASTEFDPNAIEGKVIDELQTTLDWMLGKAAQERGNRKEDQLKIYYLQMKKQEVMEKLKEDIRKLDDVDHSEEKKPGDRIVVSKDGKFFKQGYYGKKNRLLTVGEIMTDGEWGIDYFLEPDTVPRNFRKRFLIEKAKRELRNHLDDQIILDESTSNQTHEWKQDAYKNIQTRKEHREMQEKSLGTIAEKMVKNFFSKLCYDYDMDFTVLFADVYQDVEQKVDFIIRRKKHSRGVGVVPAENESIGIQFTVNTSKEKLFQKKKQLKRSRQHLTSEDEVDDIVLVSMPLMDIVGNANKRWQNDFKPSGGPDRYLDKDIKKEIFMNVLKGIFTNDELEKQWAKM